MVQVFMSCVLLSRLFYPTSYYLGLNSNYWFLFYTASDCLKKCHLIIGPKTKCIEDFVMLKQFMK